jgi:hypothetical protein
MRTIALPASDADATAVVALVIGNLARDESAALVASLAPPPGAPALPPAAPAPAAPAPPPPPSRPASPTPERPRAHGVSLGFVPPFAVDIAGSDGPAFDLVAGAHDRTTGFSISAVGSAIGEVHGAQIGGALAIAGRIEGAQIGGALAIAREVTVRVEAESAAQFLASLAPAEGAWTVVWHSVMWMYLDDAEREAVLAHLERAGAAADDRAPLAHVAFEAPPFTADSGIGFEIRVRTWPGGDEQVLGHAPAHGLPVDWL